MSDLAPLVIAAAAAVRDKVVLEQQDEIHRLKTENSRLEGLLASKNPWRTVALVLPESLNGGASPRGGVTYVQTSLHIEDLLREGDTSLFEGEPDVVLPLRDFLSTELHIDGGTACRIRDLELWSLCFVECPTTHEHFAMCRLDQGRGDDLTSKVYVGPLSLEQYADFIGVPLCEIALSATPDLRYSCSHPMYDRQDRLLTMGQLESLCDDRNSDGAGRAGSLIVKLFFEESAWRCSAEFVLEHLNVPYDPAS